MTGRFQDWMERLRLFRGGSDEHATSFRRLSQYYVDRNWQHFDEEGKRMLKQAWPDPISEFHRHDLFHKIVMLLFVPLWTDKTYPELVEEFNSYLGEAAKRGAVDSKAWAIHLRDHVLTKNIQADLIGRLHFTMDSFGAMAPALALEFYGERDPKAINRMRIMRDDFDTLKLHVLSSFELCHKALAIPVALRNSVQRGSWDVFPNGKPRDLEAFIKLPNARKPEYLAGFPLAYSMWMRVFDRTLRNAIGHYSVRHDLPSGRLVFDDGTDMPYIEFVRGSLRLVNGLLYALQLVKMMYIAIEIRERR